MQTSGTSCIYVQNEMMPGSLFPVNFSKPLQLDTAQEKFPRRRSHQDVFYFHGFARVLICFLFSLRVAACFPLIVNAHGVAGATVVLDGFSGAASPLGCFHEPHVLWVVGPDFDSPLYCITMHVL